jgi:hypothetical protein
MLINWSSGNYMPVVRLSEWFLFPQFQKTESNLSCLCAKLRVVWCQPAYFRLMIHIKPDIRIFILDNPFQGRVLEYFGGWDAVIFSTLDRRSDAERIQNDHVGRNDFHLNGSGGRRFSTDGDRFASSWEPHTVELVTAPRHAIQRRAQAVHYRV